VIETGREIENATSLVLRALQGRGLEAVPVHVRAREEKAIVLLPPRLPQLSVPDLPPPHTRPKMPLEMMEPEMTIRKEAQETIKKKT